VFFTCAKKSCKSFRLAVTNKYDVLITRNNNFIVMSVKYKFWNANAVYFVTFSVIDWIDVFTRNTYREILTASIEYCIQNKGLVVHAWVLMSNHVHLVVSLQPESTNSFSDIMRDMKKYTSMQLIKAIRENEKESRKDWMVHLFQRAGRRNSNNTQFQFWQQDNHPIEIKDEQQCYSTIQYIHNNPVTAGWTKLPEQYPWSSATDYAEEKGLITVAVMELVHVK